ncbi:MAG: metal-dependent hydrolase [Thermodesulfobacteriota bacterium]
MAFDKQPVSEGKVVVEWLGHGSFLFTSVAGKRILLDPWISTNPKCPGKYRNFEGFGSVDMILWTHGHVDHFMLEDAKKLIGMFDPLVIAPWELAFFIKSEIPRANCQIFTLGNKGATADFSGIKLTMTEASHSAGAQLTGFEGKNHFVGEAVGFLLEFENGLRIYHSGDTGLLGSMSSIIGEYYRPHIAILPIGGVFTMGPDEAAYACKLIQPDIVIPEHYATFPVLTPNAVEFEKRLGHWAPNVKMKELIPGNPASF